MIAFFSAEEQNKFLELHQALENLDEALRTWPIIDINRFLLWKRLYEKAYICDANCGWKGHFIDTIHLGPGQVPASYRGHYCPSCAEKLLSEFTKQCAGCGSQFAEVYPNGNNQLCEDCRSGKLHREELILKANLDRARESGLPATLTLSQWLKTLDHFDWKCAYCGGNYEALEHFLPISKGGGTTADNCVPSCTSCNQAKRKIRDGITKEILKSVGSYLSR